MIHHQTMINGHRVAMTTADDNGVHLWAASEPVHNLACGRCTEPAVFVFCHGAFTYRMCGAHMLATLARGLRGE
jgi:hypothetical protein